MNKIVGNNLKTFRKEKNLSQEEIAEHLNISQSAYARMERGESASWANHFNKICEVFDRTPEELVRKEQEGNFCNTEKMMEMALLNVYRKIIKKYELQIEDLKTIIRHLNKGKN